MKRIITLSLAIAALASCTKKVETIPTIKLAENYYYYIVDRDLDDATSRTKIFVIGNGKDTIINTKIVTDTHDNNGCNNSTSNEGNNCPMLPVKFTNVSFTKTGETQVTAQWTASIEQNVKRYEIWRSTDGINYTLHESLGPKGEGTTYTVVDDMSK